MPLALCHDIQPNAVSKWDISKVKLFGTRILGFDMVYCKVKNTFGFQPYRWQAAVIWDILNRFYIAVHASTSLRKYLSFQAFPRIKIRAIILMVLPILALMEDQVDKWLILLLTYPVSDNVLVLYNAKKKESALLH